MSTLVGSFVCEGGLIAYADSELGYGDSVKLQSTCSKWQMFLGPTFNIFMSGAGAWNYVQMALEKLRHIFKDSPDIPETLLGVENIVEQVLVDLYEKHFRVIQPQPFDVILAVRRHDGVVGIIKSDATAVTLTYQHEAIGSGAIIANCLMQILYRQKMSIKEGVLLAAFILWVANKYIQGVGGPSTILAMTDRIDSYPMTSGLDKVFEELHSVLQASWSIITRPAVSPQDVQKTLTHQAKALRKIRDSLNEVAVSSEPWEPWRLDD